MSVSNKEHGIVFWEKWFRKKNKDKNYREVKNFWERRYYDTFEKVLLREVKGLVKGSLKVLEAGSGSGEAALRLAQIGNDVTLVDASRAALKYSESIAKNKHAVAKFIYGDLFELPFEAKYYDFVFNVGIIEEYDLSESMKIIKEMARVTKEGGFVIIGIPNPRNLEIAYSRKFKLWKGLERNYHEIDLENMMIKAGLEKVKIKYVPTLFAFGYFNFLKPLVSRLPTITRTLENLFIRYSVVILGIGKIH